jgi:hypothetical protein
VRHPLFVASVVLGAISVVIYVCTALKRKKHPELADGVHVFASVAGALGALRLLELVMDQEFATAPGPCDLSTEDSLVICIGALALIWVSVELTSRAFKSLR